MQLRRVSKKSSPCFFMLSKAVSHSKPPHPEMGWVTSMVYHTVIWFGDLTKVVT